MRVRTEEGRLQSVFLLFTGGFVAAAGAWGLGAWDRSLSRREGRVQVRVEKRREPRDESQKTPEWLVRREQRSTTTTTTIHPSIHPPKSGLRNTKVTADVEICGVEALKQ